jgi:hypothetical protein
MKETTSLIREILESVIKILQIRVVIKMISNSFHFFKLLRFVEHLFFSVYRWLMTKIELFYVKWKHKNEKLQNILSVLLTQMSVEFCLRPEKIRNKTRTSEVELTG